MKYIFWDIDGTLLLTGGAGVMAMIDVIKEHYFLKDFKFDKTLAGRTDSDIIRGAVLQIKGKFNAADAANLLIRYHMALPKHLPQCFGSLLYNVEETLKFFDDPANGYKNCLLTGNTKTGTKLKLAHYGIEQYFDFNRSAFGEMSEDRSQLAKILWQRFYSVDPTITPDQFIFVGDTPNDVKCANAIDAKCLIVLNGSSYSREDFEQVKPWKIIDHLPDDPSELKALFDEA